MKILVLGATGVMGTHLVKLLVKEQNCKVVCTSRVDRPNIYGENVVFVKGNAHDRKFLGELLKEPWDVIVDFMYYTTVEFVRTVDVLLQATEQYIFFSSSRVYADSGMCEITENSPRLLEVCDDEEYLKTNDYALAKCEQENCLLHHKKSNWTIIRPYITYSEQRLQLGAFEKERFLYRALMGRTIVFQKELMDKYTTMTYGGDVASRILKVIGNEAALGEIYQIATSESHTWGEVLNIYSSILEEKLGLQPKIMLVDNTYDLIPQGQRYQIKHDRIYNRRFNCDKINALAKNDVFLGLREGLEKSLEEFLTESQFRGVDWGSEALTDKIAKEHADLKEIPRNLVLSYLKIRYIPVRR